VTFCLKNVYFRGIQAKLIKQGIGKIFGIKQCIGRGRNNVRILFIFNYNSTFILKPKRFCRLTMQGMIRAGTFNLLNHTVHIRTCSSPFSIGGDTNKIYAITF